MVSRSRKQCRALLGQRTGDQATNTTRDLRTPLYVYPALSNVHYRLTEQDGITRLRFAHRAMGQISHSPQIPRRLDSYPRRLGQPASKNSIRGSEAQSLKITPRRRK